MSTLSGLFVLAAASAMIFVGIRLFDRTRIRTTGLLLMGLGFGIVGLTAWAHVTARFGPERLWFRAPTFYVALAILLACVIWWLRRPTSRALRFGVLGGVIALGGALLAPSFVGRGAPAAMLVPTLGVSAPDLSFVDEAGRTRRLSEFKGSVVLINFWATWCGPCRKEMPMLARMQRDHAGQRFSVLYLSLEDPQVLAEFLKANHFDGIQGRLVDAPAFYDAGKFYPLSYLVSREGRVVKRWSGRPGEKWLSSVIQKEL